MPKFRHVNPLGDVEVPLLRRVLAAGEEFEVSDEIAERLLDQPDNYQLVTPPKKKG